MRSEVLFIQEYKENQEKRERAMQERKAEVERLQREAEERAVLKKKKELADRKRIEREQRIESLKKTAVGIRALETITAEVIVLFCVGMVATNIHVYTRTLPHLSPQSLSLLHVYRIWI